MSDQWTDRLSEYLDGEVGEPERAELEAHLAGCADCAAMLAELRQVVTRAGALDDRPPASNLWPGIAERIGLSTDELTARRRARERRFSFTVPQLVAASLALIAVSVGAAWLALHDSRLQTAGGQEPPRQIVNVPQSPRLSPDGQAGEPPRRAVPAPQVVGWAPRFDSKTDSAVVQLRLALAEGRRTGRIDSLTIRTLEHSLAVIDSAIAEARRALATDPNSVYLNHHLADTMRRKLDLLREASLIAAPRT